MHVVRVLVFAALVAGCGRDRDDGHSASPGSASRSQAAVPLPEVDGLVRWVNPPISQLAELRAGFPNRRELEETIVEGEKKFVEGRWNSMLNAIRAIGLTGPGWGGDEGSFRVAYESAMRERWRLHKGYLAELKELEVASLGEADRTSAFRLARSRWQRAIIRVDVFDAGMRMLVPEGAADDKRRLLTQALGFDR